MADDAVSNLCLSNSCIINTTYDIVEKVFHLRKLSLFHLVQVVADVLVVVTERAEILTLDTCTSLLPLMTALLGSNMDR